MQHKFCCVHLVGRSWRTWKVNQITPIYLSRWTMNNSTRPVNHIRILVGLATRNKTCPLGISKYLIRNSCHWRGTWWKEFLPQLSWNSIICFQWIWYIVIRATSHYGWRLSHLRNLKFASRLLVIIIIIIMCRLIALVQWLVPHGLGFKFLNF